MDYLVDVIMSVYNHELYIAQAIESIIAQKTDFNYRIIIGEDCSTDNTKEIIMRYEKLYPEKIFPLYREKNIGSLGNGHYLLSTVTSKYVAILEGDDYWTDEYKLQKQVAFLEANPDFSMCFTGVQVVDELGWDKPLDDYFPKIEKDVLTMADFICSFKSVIPTPTILFRNVLPRPLPPFFLKCISGDIFIHFMVADKGKTKYLSDVTAVYRNHSGGITKDKEIILVTDDMRVLLYEETNKFLGYRYDSLFRKQLVEMLKVRIIYGSRDLGMLGKIKNLWKNLGKYIKYSDKLNIKEIIYFIGVLFFPSLLKRISQRK
jgi:glycosyltransferase involved in cell wall biosynthesis